MREIKFRAWDKDLKEMFYLDRGHFMIGRTGQACMFYNEWLDKLIKGGFVKEGGHKPKILMAFTGLKDKNGKEICEGDIVQSCTDSRSFKASELKAVMEFQVHSYYSGICPDDYMNACCYWEIIGNIHEHPKLLK